MALPVYTHSGRMGLASIVLGPAAGLAAGILLALLYQYAVYYIPFIYVNFLLTLALGAGIGLACGFALKFGKCRNGAVALAIGAVCALAAVAASHVVNYRIVIGEVQKELAADGVSASDVEAKLDFQSFLRLRADTGWTIGKSGSGMPISGVFVWLVWLIELGAVTGTSAVLANMQVNKPFCENCDQWAVPEHVGSLTPAAYTPLKSAIAGDNMEAVISPTRDPKSDKTAVFTLHRCPACRQSTFLSCKVTYKVMEKGKATEKSEDVFDFIAVDEGQIETLKQSLSGAQREPLPKMAPAVKKPLNAAPAGKPLPGKAPPRKLPPQ